MTIAHNKDLMYHRLCKIAGPRVAPVISDVTGNWNLDPSASTDSMQVLDACASFQYAVTSTNFGYNTEAVTSRLRHTH